MAKRNKSTKKVTRRPKQSEIDKLIEELRKLQQEAPRYNPFPVLPIILPYEPLQPYSPYISPYGPSRPSTPDWPYHPPCWEITCTDKNKYNNI